MPASARLRTLADVSDDDVEHGSLGGRIRQARKAAGISQSDLGRLVGVESQTISLYEREKIGDPRMQTVAAIAAALRVSVDWLVRGTEVPDSRVEPADDAVRTVVRQYLEGLDPDDPRRPSADEERWLDGLSFRVGGLALTPSLLGRLLLEYRAQEAGKLREAPKVDPPPARPGRRKLKR